MDNIVELVENLVLRLNNGGNDNYLTKYQFVVILKEKNNEQ